MPTVPRRQTTTHPQPPPESSAQAAPRPPAESHRQRATAESFGVDAPGYDRARPGYPEALVSRILSMSPGRRVLDVGCGTGIAARQFQAEGCTVLGIEPDLRMAEFARGRGTEVEVATFEEWDPVGRKFDAVIAAQSWHWIDPALGATKAAEVLRPNGVLAIFSHTYDPPPEVADPYAAALKRVVPDSPFASLPARRPIGVYQQIYATIADSLRTSGRFEEPEQWLFEWTQDYTREQWLALLPTTGVLTRLAARDTMTILEDVGAAIDELGGTFTMSHTTLAAAAHRNQ
jgi:SAM-dependent methyltransferase